MLRPVLEPKLSALLRVALIQNPGYGGPATLTQPSTEWAFSLTILTDRTWPVCQAQHSQEVQPLCLRPTGKQETYPLVAIAGHKRLQMGQRCHWLLSFRFLKMPHPLDEETLVLTFGLSEQMEWCQLSKYRYQIRPGINSYPWKAWVGLGAARGPR